MFFKKKTRWYKVFESTEDANERVPLYKTDTVLAGGKKICIAHSQDGFFAVSDRCPHNGFSLGKGWCTENNTVVCPLHRYAFDLKTGRARTGLADYVNTFPVEVRPDGIYVGIEATVFTLFGE
ncbi:MAG TPA: Rieske 2Fe-2S domain-containing protein [Bacteroidia bacterium]|jgi:nitrite reductase/ring-hydroxylating ferredoxin subunit|nr:Rieske 2Fe-2S domain-containing protein [Bacteroidia bacterium]